MEGYVGVRVVVWPGKKGKKEIGRENVMMKVRKWKKEELSTEYLINFSIFMKIINYHNVYDIKRRLHHPNMYRVSSTYNTRDSELTERERRTNQPWKRKGFLRRRKQKKSFYGKLMLFWWDENTQNLSKPNFLFMFWDLQLTSCDIASGRISRIEM